ncbi:fimbrial protein [Citrobacter farmeri]|uniref:fimbrial protein n=1 Tax=Citrobacter farmeri TaxID=67824 RepID=UPI001908C126|nr:fimbrial protein [Citrobacter farmeri]MBJ9161589.1 fimbrial protein [Citrobacter farmeri]HCD7554119.1 fimbrial protein [Citrobacter farmeri]
MEKKLLAMIVTGLMAAGTISLAQAADVTVPGGTVKFEGQVVNAACVVSADTRDQTVILSQVKSTKFKAAGDVGNQKEDFDIMLEDCDTSVSTNAAVIFNGQSDAAKADTLANTAGAGAASGVALQLYGPDGKALPLGTASSTIPLVNGENRLPLSVDYIATAATVTTGNVSAIATFNMVYS